MIKIKILIHCWQRYTSRKMYQNGGSVKKLDGVRAIWNGEKLHFRSGKLISAPDWFTEKFPEQLMDGELWMGRGTFEKLSGIVRKIQPNHNDWRQVRYMLFELPEHPGTFTRRVRKMVKLTENLKISWLHPIPQIRLNSEDALLNMLDEIVTKGGEGLMLHRADPLYHSGRSDDLLKLKPWQDAEATVVEILPGKGKFSGMMGSLLVTEESGRRFRIGTGFSNKERTKKSTCCRNCHNLQIHWNHKERPSKICQFFTYTSAVLKNLKAQLKTAGTGA